MRKILCFIIAYCIGAGFAVGAVRDTSVQKRTVSPKEISTTQRSNTTNTRTATTSRGTVTSAHTPTRSATKTNVQRSATNITKTNVSTRTQKPQTTQRTINTTHNTNIGRATSTILSASDSNTFGTGYTACRDAYFTCMDQFCAAQNESYRRCVCSSRLTDIQSRERALEQTSDQLQDFKDLNLEVISKTAAEVNAMLSATTGETVATKAKDKSSSAEALSNISNVLNKTKQQAMSTQGQLDVAGDINEIWSTTDLADGANIANLTGEALYNAVNAQCSQIVTDICNSSSTLQMVISAYGMYIENDCTTLSNALTQKKNTANSTIRETEREMQVARLENYNTHNATSINNCIANVRADVTKDSACGTDFVHCLDTSGKYLNITTGEPIYTADFYQLESQISLSGDILNNQSNRMIVSKLNNMRQYAKQSLDTCDAVSADVWDEFMRQAIREIYQSQQERVRKVKDECLNIVNECYDEQSASLKDFSNSDAQSLIGQRLELAEEMCATKMNTCTNLYGNVDLLLVAMHNITDQKIAQNCEQALTDYVAELCAVPSSDSLHANPYNCRTYAPGEQYYAGISVCNTTQENIIKTITEWLGTDQNQDQCTQNTGGLVLGSASTLPLISSNGTNASSKIDTVSLCRASTTTQKIVAVCGEDYVGSLYQKLARYAQQVCVRPSSSDSEAFVLPTTILENINVVMDATRLSMSTELSKECERLGGMWVTTEYDENKDSGVNLHTNFYNETGANKKWGYCKETETNSTNRI